MGSRERKRAERRKRKRRGAERPEAVPGSGGGDAAGAPREAGSGSGRSATDLASRAEARDQEAREALEPLAEGERPTVVTVGAVISTLVAAIFWVSAVVALVFDVEVNGSEQRPLPIALFAAVVSAMAYGMWKARYWAVLGFQAFLVLIMLSAALGLVSVTTVLQAIGTTLLLALAGTLFYFMVKALARIQMPQRRPPD
jgi:hypothetical protein